MVDRCRGWYLLEDMYCATDIKMFDSWLYDIWSGRLLGIAIDTSAAFRLAGLSVLLLKAAAHQFGVSFHPL